MEKQTLKTYLQEITDFCQTVEVLMQGNEHLPLSDLKGHLVGLPAHDVIMGCLNRDDLDWLLRVTWSKFSTLKDSQEWNELFDELVDIQNNGYHDHHDLITITDFMGSLEELEAHVKANRR